MKQWLKKKPPFLILPCLMMLFLGANFPETVTFNFSYKVKVKDIPTGAEHFQIYVPAPVSDHAQKISELEVDSDHDMVWKKDAKFRNKYGYLKLTGQEIPERIELELSMQVQRHTIANAQQYAQTAESFQKHLRPDSLIPLNPEIRQETQKALEIKNPKSNPTKAFYDYLIESMKYDKSGQGWGRGDALYACNAKEGNCTDFHSLFLGMCRVKGVPARFHIGFPIAKDKTEGHVKGYHCWAEYHNSDKGWVPVDISEAWKNKQHQDFYYGGLDPYRVKFTTGRDIPVTAPDGQKRVLNYFIYPEVWVDGQKHEALETTFGFRKIEEK